jgi:hypothetical protein
MSYVVKHSELACKKQEGPDFFKQVSFYAGTGGLALHSVTVYSKSSSLPQTSLKYQYSVTKINAFKIH